MKFDVFLSHNSVEKPAVEGIAEKLKREAIEPWLDKWCLTAGGNWQDELAAGLLSSSSCAVFVGASGIGEWAKLEFQLATDRMAKEQDFRVFLVLLPGLPTPFDSSLLPPFLTTRTWVDLRQGINDPRAFQQLVNAIKGLAFGSEIPIEPRDDVCPYRGLQTFEAKHAEFFFGRDADIQRLVERLKTTRLLAVVGPSGSGKSSLVRAGLLPALEKGALQGSDAWAIHVFTPGARPLTQLVANLQRLYPRAAAGDTLDELNADARAFHLQTATALADRPSAERAVWVVDQFEEVFTLCQDESERRQFIANLLYAALAPGGRSVVVFTMRADFYQKCAAYPELSAQIIGQQFLVSPMSVEGLRQAIQEPAWRVGLDFEPGLVETILDDVESQPGALPLLEHALLELWVRRRARLLTLEAYRETGGVGGAIAKRADAIYESFDAERQAIVRRVMLRLTQPGEGTEDTRRRATMSELITHAGEADKVASVVQALADARLVMTDSNADTETVDVSHEALIRSWPRLRHWIDEDRAGLRILRRVTEAAQEWQKANEDESLLFRGARLAQALELRERNEATLNDLERKLLTASAELRDREQRAARLRTRRVIIGLVIALTLISTALIYAIIQSRRASQRETEARSRELAANAAAQLSVNPELALILAIEAAKTWHSTETENTLRQVLARAPVHRFRAVAPALLTGPGPIFSPDGKNILIAFGPLVELYDTETGRSTSQLEESGAVSGVAYSPDGKLIATTTAEGAAHIWDAITGRRVAQQLGAMDERRDETSPLDYGLPVFSPDSRFLVVGGKNFSRVLEAGGGAVTAEIAGRHPTFSRDGKFLMTGRGEIGTIRGATLYIYDAAYLNNAGNLKPLAEIPTMMSFSDGRAIGAFSPDGMRAFVIQNKVLDVFDIKRKRLEDGSRIPTKGRAVFYGAGDATAFTFSPDGKLLALATTEMLQLMDTSTWGKVVLATYPTAQGTSLSFSPDGRFLLATDDQAHLYDVRSKRLLAEFGVINRGGLESAEFSPDGKYVLTQSDEGTVRLWDLNPWRAVADSDSRVVSTDSASILSAGLSPEGKIFITTGHSLDGGGSTVRVWEPASGLVISEIRLPAALSSVKLSPDGKLVLTADNEKVRTWDLSSGRVLLELKIDGLEGAQFNPNGKFIATRSRLLIQLWDAYSGQPRGELKAEPPLMRTALSTSGKLVLMADGRGTQIWDISGNQAVKVHSDFLDSLSFSPDDKLILGKWDYLEVRDASIGRVISEFRGNMDILRSAAFSPDGNFVVTASEPTTDKGILETASEVQIWDVSSGNNIYDFLDHSQSVRFAKFSPDGRYVLAADYDGTVRVYACDLCVSHDELLKLAQKRRVRELTPDERARYQL